MISKDCTITIDKGNASVDEDVYLYKNDMNIQILFTIVNNKYRYTKNTAIDNIIANNKASYAQVKFKKGDIEIDFEEQETKEGAVVLLIKKELIDEDTELGDYSIQIRLFDENKTSVITLPPVENCIHIQRPLFEKAGEDTNIVDQALTDMAVVTYAEPISATNSDGTYNKKTWVAKEKITTAELNRIETGIKTNSVNIKTMSGTINEINTKIWDIQNPFDISSITLSPNIAQMGSTVSPKLTWNYTHSVIKSQTINKAAVENTLRTKTFTGVTATTTYTLDATSNNDTQKSKSATITFANGVYYGKSTAATYDNELINSLTKQLSNSKNRTITVNVGAGEYIFYCVPSRLGACSFNVGGFDGGFSKVATVNFTNSDNYAEKYDIYKSDNANLGNTDVTIK
ncbi:MAG: hypothetical protein ACLSXF_06650 [Clostridium sp.]